MQTNKKTQKPKWSSHPNNQDATTEARKAGAFSVQADGVLTLTLVAWRNGPGPPGLLMEARAAAVTALPAGVMLTLTLQLLAEQGHGMKAENFTCVRFLISFKKKRKW